MNSERVARQGGATLDTFGPKGQWNQVFLSINPNDQTSIFAVKLLETPKNIKKIYCKNLRTLIGTEVSFDRSR